MTSIKMAISIVFLMIASSLLTKAVMIDLNRSPPPSSSDSANNGVISHKDKQQPERLPLEGLKAEAPTPKRKRSKGNQKKRFQTLEQVEMENVPENLASRTKRRKRMIAKMTEEEREKYFDRIRMYERGQSKARKERGKNKQDSERRRKRIAKMSIEEREQYNKRKREMEKQQYQNRKERLGYGRKLNETVKNIRLKIKKDQATLAEIAQAEKVRLYEVQKYQKKKARQGMTSGKT